ncbi:hypothetical protein WJX74_009613 [Apatococcus lobatus]|uniref:NYN domain-containing protein n=1 Tax=Apatococcus lobatus TaxID=904363 RepID=A0AAW1QXZ6_9CHLO
MASTLLEPDQRPAGAGNVPCTALWDLDTCKVPQNALPSASFIVEALTSCLGASIIFASSSNVQQQQEQQREQLAVLQQIPALRILPSAKQAATGPSGTSYSSLHRVFRGLSASGAFGQASLLITSNPAFMSIISDLHSSASSVWLLTDADGDTEHAFTRVADWSMPWSVFVQRCVAGNEALLKAAEVCKDVHAHDGFQTPDDFRLPDEFRLPDSNILGADSGQEAPSAAVRPHEPIPTTSLSSKDSSDAGWQEVTRQGKKQAQAAAAALSKAPALPPAMEDPRAPQPDVPHVHPSPKFCQCSIRMTPFPGQWSHHQARQACQGYAAHYGVVLKAWTGFSNSGRLYGAVHFAKQASAKRMMTAYHTKGVPGAPKSLLFIEWQGKVPASIFGGTNQPSATRHAEPPSNNSQQLLDAAAAAKAAAQLHTPVESWPALATLPRKIPSAPSPASVSRTSNQGDLDDISQQMTDAASASASPSASPQDSDTRSPSGSQIDAQTPNLDDAGKWSEDAPEYSVVPPVKFHGPADDGSTASHATQMGINPFMLSSLTSPDAANNPPLRSIPTGQPHVDGSRNSSASPFDIPDIYLKPTAESLSVSARPFNPRRVDFSPPRQVSAHLARTPTKHPDSHADPEPPADPDPLNQVAKPMQPDTPPYQQHTPVDAPAQSSANLPGTASRAAGDYDLELLQQMHVCTVGVLGFPEGMDHAAVIAAARELCKQHGPVQKASTYANKQNRPFALVRMASAEPAATAVQAHRAGSNTKDGLKLNTIPWQGGIAQALAKRVMRDTLSASGGLPPKPVSAAVQPTGPAAPIPLQHPDGHAPQNRALPEASGVQAPQEKKAPVPWRSASVQQHKLATIHSRELSGSPGKANSMERLGSTLLSKQTMNGASRVRTGSADEVPRLVVAKRTALMSSADFASCHSEVESALSVSETHSPDVQQHGGLTIEPNIVVGPPSAHDRMSAGQQWMHMPRTIPKDRILLSQPSVADLADDPDASNEHELFSQPSIADLADDPDASFEAEMLTPPNAANLLNDPNASNSTSAPEPIQHSRFSTSQAVDLQGNRPAAHASCSANVPQESSSAGSDVEHRRPVRQASSVKGSTNHFDVAAVAGSQPLAKILSGVLHAHVLGNEPAGDTLLAIKRNLRTKLDALEVEFNTSQLLSVHKLLLRDASERAAEDSGVPEAIKALGNCLRTLMKTRVPISLHWDAMQIFRNIGKRKFILMHCQWLLSEAAQLVFCSATPGNSIAGTFDDCIKVTGTPDNLVKAQLKIAAACDRLQLLQESMQLSLDDMLPEHLKNKASWLTFSSYVTRELQNLKAPAAVFTVLSKTSKHTAVLDISITAAQSTALASAKKLYRRAIQPLSDIKIVSLSGTQKLQAERALATFRIPSSTSGVLLQTQPGSVIACSSTPEQAGQLLMDFLIEARLA